MWTWVSTNWNFFSFAIGVVLALLGIGITVWLHGKSQRVKKPFLVFVSRRLLKPETHSYDGLNLTANGKPVKQLTLTKVTFWNAGKDVVDKLDVAQPITLSMNADETIIGWKILHSGDESNRFSVLPVKKSGQDALQLEFEYVDHSDGIALMIAHTGRDSRDIRLDAKIKTVKKVQRLDFFELEKLRDFVDNPRLGLAGLIPMLTVVATLLLSVSQVERLIKFCTVSPENLELKWFLLVGAVILCELVIALFASYFLTIRLLFPTEPPPLKLGTSSKF